MAETSYYCEKCNRTMGPEQFYTSNNLEKYPNDGKLNQCKKCITMHVDNWNPDTYLWILKEVDVPYVPKEWNELLAKYGVDKKKVTGISILGRYLSKMKLKQYKDYRWEHTQHLQEIANKKIEETMLRQGYDRAQIDEVIQKGTFSTPDAPLPPPPPQPQEPQDDPAAIVDNALSQQVEQELIADLTDEDRRYLCLKWGKSYRPEEWIRLEELYTQMINSYDVQAAGDLNTLKLACKSSLKANQLLDLGDIDGAQKAGKMYDSFMKAGKWTAQQNKTTDNELVDSIGELVAICERDGFIPKYYVDTPKDKADRVLEDMQHYTKDLIENESGLSVIMERATKQITEEEQRIAAAAAMGEDADEESMFNYEKPAFDIEDYAEFKEFEDDLSEEDAEYMATLLDEGGDK